MSDQRIKIPRASDRLVAEALQAVALKWGAAPVTISALGFGRVSNVSLQSEPEGDWKTLLDLESELIDHVALQVCGLNVTYVRGGQCQPEHKSAVVDEIVISQIPQQTSSNQDKFSLIALLNEKFRAFNPKRLPGADPTEVQGELWAMHQSTLERLEKVNEDLVRDSLDFRQKLERQHDAKIAQLEETTHKKIDSFEAEYQNKLAEVEARDKTLQEKLAAIDDRNNTHVRREIRDKMLDDVRQRIDKFGVSESTEAKRTPVLIGIFLLAVVLGLLLFWTAWEISTLDKQYVSSLKVFHDLSLTDPDRAKTATPPSIDKVNLYWLWARFTILSLGLAGTALYYIKWQNKWAEQHANSEFQLQQFYIDVNRANWVIESCLEWRKATQTVIPKELLASITNGLFANKQADIEKVIHPADELASALMGSASKLKLNLGGNEVEIDKPRKITKEITSNSR